MFKFLLIICIIVFLLYKVGTFFFKAGAASQQLRDFEQRSGFNAKSQNAAKEKKQSKFDGGEYIDYEEVNKKK